MSDERWLADEQDPQEAISGNERHDSSPKLSTNPEQDPPYNSDHDPNEDPDRHEEP